MPRRVEVPRRGDLRDERLDSAPVPRLGRPDEVVVLDLEGAVELVVSLDDAVRELDRGDALRRGRLLDVLAVLVGAGQEPRLLADQAPVARQRVRDDGRVDVPDVGQIVDVVDRRRRVEGLHAGGRKISDARFSRYIVAQTRSRWTRGGRRISHS